MRIRNIIATAVGTAAFVALLAGCGSTVAAPPGSTDAASTPSAGAPSPTPTPTPTPTAERLTTLDSSDSPLQAFLWEGAPEAPVPVDDADADAKAKAEWDEWQRRLGECMKAEGFDYDPEPWDDGSALELFDEPSDTREFVDQYGLGIANNPAQEEADATERSVTYVETLSESARLEYEVALSGEWFRQAQIDHDTETPTAWQDLGCTGKVEHDMTPADAKPSPWDALHAEFGDLDRGIEEISNTAMQSPEMSALSEKWAACMAKAGHPYASTRDMFGTLYAEFGAFSVPDPERPAYSMIDKSAPGYNEFVDKEMAIASADYDCRKALDYPDEVMRISFAYEQKFLDDHRAELEKYRDALQLAYLG